MGEDDVEKQQRCDMWRQLYQWWRQLLERMFVKKKNEEMNETRVKLGILTKVVN